MKYVVGISREHHANVCLLKHGKVIYSLQEERLSRYKYDGEPFLSILKLKDFTKEINGVALCGLFDLKKIYNNSFGKSNTFFDILLYKLFLKNKFEIIDFNHQHHLMHAAGAFYNSGFKNAISIVFDGIGAKKNSNEFEKYSSYECSYPCNFKIIEKEYFDISKPQGINNPRSLGHMYGIVTSHLGLGDENNSGKTMGLSSFGKIDDYKDIYNLFDPFKFELNKNNELYYKTLNLKNFEASANLAKIIQIYTQETVLNTVLKLIKKTNYKNFCLSGGYFLNCLNNYNLIKKLPKDINLHIEPIANDAGTAIGAAKYLYYLNTNNLKKNKQNTIYYGPKYKKYNLKNCKTKKCSFKEIAMLLKNNKIVAMYQGSSEQGPRALGNRSILFNPCNKNGKNIINKIKKRENFRPFAGTVLHKYAKNYFKMLSLKESPFMMYAIEVKENKIKEIPAIVHVDNTCRVQTLKKTFNKKFYNLINEFYKLTNVPILLNTSFNLNNEPIVETIEDALNTFYNSDINYLFLPDIMKVIKNEKKQIN